MVKKLVIFGGGGFAREVSWLVAEINLSLPVEDNWEVIGFVEYTNERVGQLLNGIPIINIDDLDLNFSETYAVVAIGIPSVQRTGCESSLSLWI